MDTASLVDKQINDGQKLIDQLSQSGFDVAAAFWLKLSDKRDWRFYIVSPVVDADLGNAYAMIRGPVRAMPQPYTINPLKIRLLGTTDPIAKDVLEIQRSFTKVGLNPAGWKGSWLGNMSIDGAYFYPLPAVTTP